MFKDPHSEFNRINQNIFLLSVYLLSKYKFLSYISYLIEGLGRSLEIIRLYSNAKFEHPNQMKYPFMASLRRESLWEKAIELLDRENWFCLEFGVAWGYSTNYHVSRSSKMIAWHGFDTFTGLPEDWRSYKKGHFNNYNQPPAIKDIRIEWHKGLIEETLTTDFLQSISMKQKYIVFDLDLFHPTYFALKSVTPYLSKGDLLYFDEPNDIDEGSLLHIFFKINSDKLRVIGCTPCQVLLEVLSHDLQF